MSTSLDRNHRRAMARLQALEQWEQPIEQRLEQPIEQWTPNLELDPSPSGGSIHGSTGPRQFLGVWGRRNLPPL
jgi:hypothetical protein